MRLPVDLPELLRAGNQLSKDREAPVRALFVIEPDAPDALLDSVQGAFRAQTSAAVIDVKLTSEVVEGTPIVIPDIAIVLIGSGYAAAASIETLRRAAVPVAGLAMTTEKAAVAAAAGLAPASLFAGADALAIMREQLAPWIVERLPQSRIALAHNFPVLRRAVADYAIRTTAWQNAVIGLVAFLPGADLPLMTANQAKMVLQIAAVYGEPLGPERIKELGAVVAGGFMFRTIARQAVAFVPGFGWAFKAGIGYTGTIAMGRAAAEYFEDGADIYTVVARLQLQAEDLGKEAGQMLERGEVPDPLKGDGPRKRFSLPSRKRGYTVAESKGVVRAEPEPRGAAG